MTAFAARLDLASGELERLEGFVGDAPQYDDTTILALRWLGSRA